MTYFLFNNLFCLLLLSYSVFSTKIIFQVIWPNWTNMIWPLIRWNMCKDVQKCHILINSWNIDYQDESMNQSRFSYKRQVFQSQPWCSQIMSALLGGNSTKLFLIIYINYHKCYSNMTYCKYLYTCQCIILF